MEKLYSLVSVSLVFLFLGAVLLNQFKLIRTKPFPKLWVYVAVLAFVLFFKIKGLTPAEYFYGAMSEVSATTVLLILIYLYRSLFSASYLLGKSTLADDKMIFQKGRVLSVHNESVMPAQAGIQSSNFMVLMVLIAVSAVTLYSFTFLNKTFFDLYAMGYNAIWVPAIYLLVGLFFLWRNVKYWPLLLLLMTVTVFYLLKFPNGDNFFDYLFDPFVAMYAWGYVLVLIVKKIKQRF